MPAPTTADRRELRGTAERIILGFVDSYTLQNSEFAAQHRNSLLPVAAETLAMVINRAPGLKPFRRDLDRRGWAFKQVQLALRRLLHRGALIKVDPQGELTNEPGYWFLRRPSVLEACVVLSRGPADRRNQRED